MCQEAGKYDIKGEKNQSIKINLEWTHMLELAGRDIKSYHNCVCSKSIRDTENVKETQTELLEVKTAKSEMKNTHGIHGRLDTAEEKISELEDTSKETIKNETHKKKKSIKMKSASVSCGTTTRSQTHW